MGLKTMGWHRFYVGVYWFVIGAYRFYIGVCMMCCLLNVYRFYVCTETFKKVVFS